MINAFKLRYSAAYLLSIVAVVSGIFGRGGHLLLFILPLAMSFLFRSKERVVLKKREGNIIAAIMTIVFVPLLLFQDVFVMALYYLLSLLSLKLFVSQDGRDYDHVALLSFLTFSLSTVFLYSMWYAVLFALFAIVLSLYLLLRTMPLDMSPPEGLVKHVLVSFLLIVIFSFVLFFLLPRNPYMFFGSLASRGTGDFIVPEIGEFEKENLSNRVLLRIKPEEKRNGVLYIRTRVFNRFDGKRWLSSDRWRRVYKSRVIISRNESGGALGFRVYPSVRFTYVPLVDYPLLLLWEGGRFSVSSDLAEVKLERWPKKMTYTVFATSFPSPFLSMESRGVENLEVPETLRNYLKEVLTRIKISDDTLQSILWFLRNNYRYGKFTPENDTIMPIVEFLLGKKRGECTEFATSFALLSNLAGYRSRLVVGFLTEEFNPVGEYFIIRERHAHAWVEVYKNGRWIRYDPTPPLINKKGFIEKAREYYDYIQYLWFTKIVEYSYHDQVQMALKVMPYYRSIRLYVLARGFILGFAGILFFIMVLYFVSSILFVKTHKRALRKFLRYMRKKGYNKMEEETLMEFARRSGDKVAVKFVEKYYRVRFGGKSEIMLKRFLKLL